MAAKNENIDIKDLKLEIDKYIKDKINKGVNVDEYKEEINKHVNEKLKKELNLNDFKNEIDKYVKERVEKEAASDKVRFCKKQLRNKNILIFILVILLITSLGGLAYGAYYLYKDGYFDKDKKVIVEPKKEDKVEINIDDNKDKVIEELQKKDLFEELKNKYSYLIDNIKLDNKSDYLTEFYAGNLTTELKEYLAFKLLDSDSIESDDSSSYFDVKDLSKTYSKLFNDKLVYSSFKCDGVLFKYLESKGMFIGDKLSTDSILVDREIIDIIEEDKKVTITVVEGYFKDKKLYNVKTNKEVSDYKEGDKLSSYKKKLNTISYTFNDGYLESIK